MENTLDILLRTLRNSLGKTIYISEQAKGVENYFTMVPTSVGHTSIGIKIEDNNGWFLIDEDKFELSMDDSDDCLQFSFRNKKDELYYSICF